MKQIIIFHDTTLSAAAAAFFHHIIVILFNPVKVLRQPENYFIRVKCCSPVLHLPTFRLSSLMIACDRMSGYLEHPINKPFEWSFKILYQTPKANFSIVDASFHPITPTAVFSMLPSRHHNHVILSFACLFYGHKRLMRAFTSSLDFSFSEFSMTTPSHIRLISTSCKISVPLPQWTLVSSRLSRAASVNLHFCCSVLTLNLAKEKSSRERGGPWKAWEDENGNLKTSSYIIIMLWFSWS